jgi:hypothetical protein
MPENHTLQETNHSLRPKITKSDPHFSPLGEGLRDPGFLEGGKMPILSITLKTPG